MKRFLIPTLTLALSLAAVTTFLNQAQAQDGKKEHKVGICHGTASTKHPYVLIIVDESAKAAHMAGHGKNSAPDFMVNNGAILTPEQEAYYRRLDDKTACNAPSSS